MVNSTRTPLMKQVLGRLSLRVAAVAGQAHCSAGPSLPPRRARGFCRREARVQLTAEDEEFRHRVRQWLAENLTGRFADLRGAGGPGREHEAHAERLAWNRHLAAAGWTCLGWPAEYGGPADPIAQQLTFHGENARNGGAARGGHLGGGVVGATPTSF